MLVENLVDMTELDNYEALASCIANIQFYIERGYTFDNLKKIYHDYSAGLIDRTALPYTEEIVLKSIENFKKALLDDSRCSDDANTSKVTTLINEWNEHIAPILTGVTCNSFDEFAMQVAKVAGQCIDYKIMEEAMQQQPVQPQQNQMFVDVNTLISENNYLKSLNVSKDEEIKALKARLVALGQPV